jgi:ribosomal protein S18 acetylase RimI-like enzyme
MSVKPLLRPIPWETRNLGRASFEIHPDVLKRLHTPLLAEALKKQLRLCKKIFVQARFRAENIRAIQTLTETGFHTIEQTLVPFTHFGKNHIFQNNPLPHSLRPKGWKTEKLTFDLWKGDKDSLAQIKKIAGRSFSADRFHRDPLCPRAMANQRFIYWIDDLTADPSVDLHVMKASQKTIAFMAFRRNELLLNALDTNLHGKGLGTYCCLSIFKKIQQRGYGGVQTVISAQNLPALNLYAKIGFQFREACVTLHHWAP